MNDKFTITIVGHGETIECELPDDCTEAQAREVFREHFLGRFDQDGFVCELRRHPAEALH
jgi:hypothetical protein